MCPCFVRAPKSITEWCNDDEQAAGMLKTSKGGAGLLYVLKNTTMECFGDRRRSKWKGAFCIIDAEIEEVCVYSFVQQRIAGRLIIRPAAGVWLLQY